jgi:hypothetical protein
MWSWILTAFGAFALWLALHKIWYAWAVGLFTQLLWFSYAVCTKQYGFVVSCFVFGSVYFSAFISWKRERSIKSRFKKLTT